jgi:chromosome segregation ATPase
MPVTLLKNEATTACPPSALTLDGWLTECRQIEEFIAQLFAEMDELRCEVQRKAHELELAQARLDEREQQLHMLGDEAQQVRQVLQRQDQQLAAALSELAKLRSVLTSDPAANACPNAPEHETALRNEPVAEGKHEAIDGATETSQDHVVDAVRRQFESLRSDARR